MDKARYAAPYVLLGILGVFWAVQYYIPHPVVQQPAQLMLQWKQPLNAFIIFLALGGLAGMHVRRVIKQDRRWGYSAITLTAMVSMIIAGMGFGTEQGTVFAKWFEYMITPIEATMFSLLAFFVASAAFRAFRARTLGASILLISATIVMLGLIPVVEECCPFLSDVAAFILKYINTAAKRAIVIGVALGAVTVAIKTILGVDKTVLGKD